jgi:uncharacterized Zn finger protein (UPF0148 family)
MHHNISIHCSDCGTFIPEDDVGDFRNNDGQVVCMHCFNVACMEDLHNAATEEAFENILNDLHSGYETTFYDALLTQTYYYGLDKAQTQEILEMYENLHTDPAKSR